MRKNDRNNNNISYKNKRKEDEQIIRMHGIKITSFFATPGVPLWVKVYFYIFTWYMRNPGKIFFKKYSTICNDLINCGCPCTEEGIRDAFRVLKNEDTEERYTEGLYQGKKKKGGVALIRVEYERLTKAEWVALGKNPEEYIYRKVYIDMDKARKLLSVFVGDCKLVKGLKAKSRLKKVIFQRPLSFSKRLAAAYRRQMKETMMENYTSEEQMFFGFVKKYSSKYYDTSKLTKNHITRHAINLQEVQDQENWLNISDIETNEESIYHIIDDDTGEVISSSNPKPPSLAQTFFGAIK